MQHKWPFVHLIVVMHVENFLSFPRMATYTFGSIKRKLGRHIAIIDLGTNTFHLIIYKVEGNGDFFELYKHQLHTQLGEGGLQSEDILPSAFKRGLDALREMKQIISDLRINEVVVCGTSALRSAKNGAEFKRQGEKIIGSTIRIISGKEEASIIYRGVRQTAQHISDPVLVMDIGGGSIEFVIGRGDQILWHNSYPLGGLRMASQFHKSNPMLVDEIMELKAHFKNVTHDLFAKLKEFNVNTLIGAAGSFETLAKVEHLTILNEDFPANKIYIEIDRTNLLDIVKTIKTSTLENIAMIPGMAEFRVKLISVSLIMVESLFEMHPIQNVAYSDYSLKEGMFLNYLENTL